MAIETPLTVNIRGKEFWVGQTVRFTTGRKFGPVGPDGSAIRIPGKFEIREIEVRKPQERSRPRVYFHCRGDCGTFTIYVSGPSYVRACVKWRPYNPKKAK